MTKKLLQICTVATMTMATFTTVSTQALANTSQRVVQLVNQQRRAKGLKPLAPSSSIAAVASRHAKDMDYNNYFSHTGRNGSSVGTRLKQGGVSYRAAGENIAKGQQTAERVMTAWMNSPGHRRNILSPKYGKIGVARSGNVWVQNFTN